jgi:hypothetical protein
MNFYGPLALELITGRSIVQILPPATKSMLMQTTKHDHELNDRRLPKFSGAIGERERRAVHPCQDVISLAATSRSSSTIGARVTMIDAKRPLG